MRTGEELMIYIVRHGQTEKNKANVLQGRSDVPLNEVGIRQAEDVRDRFRSLGIQFDKVYTSPLIRAVQTAKIIAEGASPMTEGRLIEMDYGPYEGMDLAQPAPEGMEALSAVVTRLATFLEEIREGAVSQNILLSTHAIAMKGALEYLTPTSGGSYWSKYIGNCAVYTAEVGADGHWTIPQEW